MVTPISVSVTAVDNATKIFQRLNANIERMQAPVKNLQRSFDRFAQLSGLNRLNEGFSRIRESATSAFRVMGQIAPILGTITSVATVAGIARLSTNWANFGSNLQTTSQRLGMSVSGLHSWQNGARLVGVSADSLTSAMGNLQENIWNARGGRNPQFIATLNTMGIAMNNADGSARSLEAITNDVANVIAKLKNPMAQATLATAAFGSEGNAILPYLRESANGMERYRREALKYGVMNEAGAKAANRLRLAQTRLTLSVEGFGNSLAQSIEPILTPIIENMANWIAVNRGWITQNIAGYVQKFSNYLKSINWQQVSAGAQQVWNSVKQFTQTIQENIEKIGGFKTILGIVAGILGMKIVGSVMSTISPFASLAMTIGRLVIPVLGSLLAMMGPIVLGIIAGGLVIGGVVAYIYKKWDPLKSWWKNIWSAVSGIFNLWINKILPIVNPFIGLPKSIYDHWDPAKSFFKNLLNGIKAYFSDAYKFIIDTIEKISWAVKKVGNALGLTKKQAEEVSNSMKIESPSSALYTPSTVANDNTSSSNGNSWVKGWFSGGDKAKPKSDSEKQIDRMTGKVGDFFTSWTKTINQTSSKITKVATVPTAATQGQAVSNVVQFPGLQQAQKNGAKISAFNNGLNGYIQQATQGSIVSPAQMQALIMTESGGRMVGNALGLTKKQAEEVSNSMKIESPSSALYTPSTVANDNTSSSNGNSWVKGWFSGGDKAKPKSDGEKQIDRMTGKVSDFFTSWTKTINQTSSKITKVATVPTASTQGQAVSNVVQFPGAQQAQKAAGKISLTNAPLNKLIAQSLTGTNVSIAQGQALAMTESSGRWQGNSKSSAVGYMQLLKGTAKGLGVDRYDPAQNVLGGIKYYNQMLKAVRGNPIAAYGAYHDGPGSAGVKRFLASGGKDYSGFKPLAQQGMKRFEQYLSKAQGGQLQLPNGAIPQGAIPPSPAIPFQSSINTMSQNMANMSNMGALTPITANSGLGQLGGGNMGIDNNTSAPAVNLPMFDNNNSSPQKLLLEIDIKGKPANMDIKANSKSSNLTVEKIKYQRAMDPMQSASGF